MQQTHHHAVLLRGSLLVIKRYILFSLFFFLKNLSLFFQCSAILVQRNAGFSWVLVSSYSLHFFACLLWFLPFFTRPSGGRGSYSDMGGPVITTQVTIPKDVSATPKLGKLSKSSADTIASWTLILVW